MVKVKSGYGPSGSSVWRISPVSVAWSDWNSFHFRLDGMLVHRMVNPSIKFAGTHLYTRVERGTARTKCLTREHNVMSPVRTRYRTARFGGERTNHEATAPPTLFSGRWLTTYNLLYLFVRFRHKYISGLLREKELSLCWVSICCLFQ